MVDEEPKKRGRKKAAEGAEPTPPKKERPPKGEPKFTAVEVMDMARAYSTSARSQLDEFNGQIHKMLEECVSDPRTYSDVITVVKFTVRRAERITLSLDELDAGLKERKPREKKERPEGEAPKKRGRPKKVVAEEVPVEVDEDEEDEEEEVDTEILDDDDDLDLDD